jgi:hypothetical protein
LSSFFSCASESEDANVRIKITRQNWRGIGSS